MRVALCLSGQVRALDANLHTILDNLVRPCNADVFCHFWDSGPGGRVRAEEAVNRLQPKAFAIAAQIDFTQHSGRGHTPRTRSQFYSVKQANNLKKQYEEQKGLTYDFVIRTRTDLVIQKPFSTKDHNPDFVYARQKPIDKVVDGEFHWSYRPSSDSLPGSERFKFEDDMFFIANSANMDIYATAYDCIDEIISLVENSSNYNHFQTNWHHPLSGSPLSDPEGQGEKGVHLVGERIISHIQNKYLADVRAFVSDIPSDTALARNGQEVW